MLDGTNFVFKQIMGEAVGDLDYDKDAELKLGAAYPEGADTAAEFLIVNQKYEGNGRRGRGRRRRSNGFGSGTNGGTLDCSKNKKRWSAPVMRCTTEKHNAMRPVSYRDFVILLRSMTTAPQMTEEFKRSGIPVYAELSSGYFEATEVSVMLNVLRVIDNPAQDIPLAAVLRSPLVGGNRRGISCFAYSCKERFFLSSDAQLLAG
ncbi:hypothetical protein GCM10020331_080290 [Ectobacillus funiculus]